MKKKIYVLKILATVFTSLLIGSNLSAQDHPLHVFTGDQLEDRDVTYRDVRLLTMKETNSIFSMPEYESLEEWEARAEYLKNQILVSSGLLPMPEKTPLNAEIFDKTEGEGYTIEKVYFEAFPDYYVTGNLYRPTNGTGQKPGIVSPHGHWEEGRLVNSETNNIPARGINLAKRGFVVFIYDMVGYVDNRQVGHDFAADSLSNAWGINLLGLQLWNSIRATDFIASLPDVNTSQIGVTGASGGGTQTFLLAAIDERIKVSIPVNMISTQMQGGCLCENAPGLRVDAFNVELAALTAPRPMLMISNTQDWTVNTHSKEYPMMQSIYKLYDADDRLKYVQYDWPHNYNQASREAAYAWFDRWFHGGEQEQIEEVPIQQPAAGNLLVFLEENITDRNLTYSEFDVSTQTPDLEVMGEDQLKEYMIEQSEQLLDDYWPGSDQEYTGFARIYGAAYEQALKAGTPYDVTMKGVGEFQSDDIKIKNILICRTGIRDWIPAVLFEPESGGSHGTVLVSSEGKQRFWDMQTNRPNRMVQDLVASGHVVLAIDPFGIGEHVLQPGTNTQRDESFGHFTTFNLIDTQERVQDILTAGTFLSGYVKQQQVNLVGLDNAGVWALLAAGVDNRYRTIVADAKEYNAMDPQDILEHYVPGLARTGGLPTALALTGTSTIQVFNAGDELMSLNTKELVTFNKNVNMLDINDADLPERRIPKLLRR